MTRVTPGDDYAVPSELPEEMGSPLRLATPVTTRLALVPIAVASLPRQAILPTQWVGQATIVAGIQLRR